METASRIADRLKQELTSEGTNVVPLDDERVVIAGASTGLGRQIIVNVQGEGQFAVAFHVPEKTGSPFELVFGGAKDEPDAVQASVIRFVADLVGERLLLVWDKSLLTGGRQFIPASGLSPSTSECCSWVRSWRGRYDRDGAG